MRTDDTGVYFFTGVNAGGVYTLFVGGPSDDYQVVGGTEVSGGFLFGVVVNGHTRRDIQIKRR